MSTYKQRTSFHRLQHQLARSSSDLREDHQPAQDSHNTTTTTTTGLPSTLTAGSVSPNVASSPLQRETHPSFASAHSIPHHLLASTTASALSNSSYHTADEDPYPGVETPSFAIAADDLEWTPIRNAASVARAKQRQQQYRERQQERTREWQFLLNQHYRPTQQPFQLQHQQQNQQQDQPLQESLSLWTTAGSSGITAAASGVGARSRPLHSNSSSNGSQDSKRLFAEQLHGGDEIIPESVPAPGTRKARSTTTVPVPTTEEHLSSGYSDLMTTSDGVESVGGGSEDLGVWSQADDEGGENGMDEDDEEEVLSFTLSAPSPVLQRHRFSFSSQSSPRMTAPTESSLAATTAARPTVSGRSDSISSTTSLSRLPRPSFANTPNTRPRSQLQQQQQERASPSPLDHMLNQMPHHDGSGNFVDVMDEQHPSLTGYRSSSQTVDLFSDLELEDSLDLDRGWESSSSQESSILREYQRPPSLSASYALRRRISSSEFKTVIQSIVDLQHQQHPFDQRGRPSSIGTGANIDNVLSSPLSLSRFQQRPPRTPPQDSRPQFTYLYSGSKRSIFNIYEDEMEDMAEMMHELPSKVGWMQTFEVVLTALQPHESSPYTVDCDKWHPIKVMKMLASEDSDSTEMSSQFPKQDASVDLVQEDASNDETKKETLRLIRENMTSANMATLQKLQQNRRSRRTAGVHHYRRPLHERTESFDPMQVDFSPTLRMQDESLSTSSTHEGITSQSAGTMTPQSVLDSNLWAVVLSTLRRFRDNFLFNTTDSYEDEDLEIQWPTLSPSPSRAQLTRENLAQFRTGLGSTRSATSSVSSYSNRGGTSNGVRRVSSDCGMESLRDHLSNAGRSYEPRLVE
ncbi:hypothetical protein BGZ83_012193 [Gryganskiella cystojenkinii]|nr:hypothetical protein BGZ83_012193 [Gryganskiella cystojenkinii]